MSKEFIGGIFCLFVVIVFSLSLGQYHIPISDIFNFLLQLCQGQEVSNITKQIILEIRLPRILCAGLSGAILALSGVVLQGIFRNPLVDAHIIGVSAGSAFGGTLAIFFSLGTFSLVFSTLFFGVLTLLLIFVFLHRFSSLGLLSLVLLGLVANGFFSALVSLIKYVSDTEEKLPSIVFWLMGSFATIQWQKFLILFACFLVFGIWIIALRWKLNLLSLGNEAKRLDSNILIIRWIILFLTALLVAGQVAVSGCIGWIGLVVPHIGRRLVGPNHIKLLPYSMLIGAIFMIGVDDIARTLTSQEIPISIITAILGAPIFMVLIWKTRIWNE